MNICLMQYYMIEFSCKQIFFFFFSMGEGGVRGRTIIAEMNLTKNVS